MRRRKKSRQLLTWSLFTFYANKVLDPVTVDFFKFILNPFHQIFCLYVPRDRNLSWTVLETTFPTGRGRIYVHTSQTSRTLGSTTCRRSRMWIYLQPCHTQSARLNILIIRAYNHITADVTLPKFYLNCFYFFFFQMQHLVNIKNFSSAWVLWLHQFCRGTKHLSFISMHQNHSLKSALHASKRLHPRALHSGPVPHCS